MKNKKKNLNNNNNKRILDEKQVPDWLLRAKGWQPYSEIPGELLASSSDRPHQGYTSKV